MGLLNPEIKTKIEMINRGEVPEGYKKTRIGIIPDDWEGKRLYEILTVRHGRDQKEIESKSGRYPILGTGGIIGKTDSFLYDKPSVLIGRKGTIDRPQYIEKPFWTIDTLFYTEIKENVVEKYIYYLFTTINWYAYNEASGVPSLNAKVIENIKVNIPNLFEQKTIVEILSTWDKAIELKEKLIEEKKKQKRGLMQRLLTRIIRLPGFEGEWEETRLKEVGEVVTGTTPSTKIKEYYEGGTYPWITPTDITENKYISRSERYLTEAGLRAGRFLPAGSLLITCIASLGKNAILTVNGSCNQQINAIITSKNYLNEFLYYLIEFHADYIKSYAGKSATEIINKNTFENLKFKIPSLQEQKAIAQILSTADREIELLEKELEQLKLQKKGLMQLLLTGIIRVK